MNVLNRQIAICSIVVLLATSATLSGCADDNPLGRQAISGAIQLNGTPLDKGSIQFSPQQGSGVSSGAVIAGGAYEIPEEKGLPVGAYVVRIFSPVEAKTPASEGEVSQLPGPAQSSSRGPSQPPPGDERIPPQYNITSEQTVDVTPDGKNIFDFDIRSPGF